MDPVSSAEGPPFVRLSGGVVIGYSAAFCTPELWLDVPSPAHDAAVEPTGAAAQAGAKLGFARHPLTGMPALCLHACGAEALLRSSPSAGNSVALRAYAQLLLWTSLALPLAGIQTDAAAFGEEAVRLAAASS